MYPALARFLALVGISVIKASHSPTATTIRCRLSGRFAEQICPRILRLNGLKFLHQIPHALVRRFRDEHLDLHILIATHPVPRAGNALLAQSQRGPAVGCWRNAHERTSINGWYFDLRAQSRFTYFNRHLYVQVVPAPFEKWMWFDLHAQIQIARRRPHGSGVALAGNA